jgi:hypothetical protein
VYLAGLCSASGKAIGLMDPVLIETYRNEGRQAREFILAVGKLAMVCFVIRSRGRANMYEVLNKLKTLWVSTYGGRLKDSGISAEENMSNVLQEEQNGILLEMEESSNSTREDESSGLVEMSE